MSSSYNIYKKNTKLHFLFKKIKEVNELENIIEKIKITPQNHLHECVMNTRIHPFLNKYIDEYLKYYPNQINNKDGKGRTILILASWNSRQAEETVKIILKHKPDANIKDIHGRTALIYASLYSKSVSTENTVKLLLEHNADVNAQDMFGRTALIYAACQTKKYASKKTVKMLLDYYANVNICDIDGQSVLLLVVRNFKSVRSEKIVELLLDHNADVNIQNLFGWSAITIASKYAVSHNYENVLKILLKYNANINLKNNYGENAVTLAAHGQQYKSNVINIILPTREHYYIHIPKNIIIRNKIKFWMFENIDYKIFLICVRSFDNIINFL